MVTWDSMDQDGDQTGIYAQIFDSAGAKVGGEIRVNSTTKGIQMEPTIVALSGSYFMIFWTTENVDSAGTAIVGQLFNPSGIKIRGERLINIATAADQKRSEAAVRGDGTVAVTFVSNNRVYFVVIEPFDGYVPPATLPVTSDALVNTYTTGGQDDPQVAALADGGYVIVWDSDAQDGSGSGTYFQRYSQTGVKVGSETRAATSTVGDQERPNVRGLRDGGFVIGWNGIGAMDAADFRCYMQRYDANGVARGVESLASSNNDDARGTQFLELSNGNLLVTNHRFVDPNQNEIFGNIYDNLGVSVTSEFQINTYTTNRQKISKVEQLTNGNAMVIWSSDGQDGGSWGVYGQVISSTGAKVGSEFQVNTYTTSDQAGDANHDYYAKGLAALTNGNAVAVWESNGQDGSGYGVYGQILSNTGTKVGSEFRVNTTTTGNQKLPEVIALNDSYFMVFWESDNLDGIGTGIVGQLFDSSGNKVGGERQINQTEGSDNQRSPAAAMLNNGNIVVTWYGLASSGDTSSYGVWHRIINPFVAETPPDINGLKLWLKADAGITKDGSNKVSAWAGQSGTLNPASQGTATKQPLWVSGGLNGYPVIRFDGVDDYMDMHASYVDILKNVKGGSVFVVEKRNGAPGGNTNNVLFNASTNNAANVRMAVFMDSATSHSYKLNARRSDGDTTASISGGTSGTTAFNLVSAIMDYNNTDAYLYVDGTLAVSNTSFLTSGSTSNTNSVTVRIGAQADAVPTGFLNGDIAEILVFNRAMLDANRKAVECYLARKYNLTLGYTCPSEVAVTAAAVGGTTTLNNGMLTYGYDGTNWTATVSCQSGYSVTGNATSTCAPGTGTWSAIPGYCSNSITTPTTVSTLKLWLDASDTASITQASGRASQWNDKSGQGNHVTQSTAGAKPYTGSRTYNGKNVMDFQNAQYMTSANPWASGTLAQPNTMFVVAAQDAHAWDYIIDGSGGGYHALGSDSATRYFMIAVAPEAPIYTTGITPDTTPKIFSLMFNDNPDSTNGSALYVNGTPYIIGGNAGALGINNIYVGGWPGNEMDGFIGEVLVYDGQLTPADRERVECYLSNKWAIGLQHPCQ
ncbi:MAG: hypothetical protein IT567_03850 [Alphaproteobacteria bacterium]|nr:hypothetical protein [Alphaproteobacteria bacterium]